MSMMMRTAPEAALARSQAIRARADRPADRRSAPEGSGVARMAARACIDLRAKAEDADNLTFDGYATAFEAPYEMWDYFGPYTEVVSAGAADDTLALANLDVPLVLAHDQLRRIARTTNGTLTLTADERGLHVLADLDPTDRDSAIAVDRGNRLRHYRRHAPDPARGHRSAFKLCATRRRRGRRRPAAP